MDKMESNGQTGKTKCKFCKALDVWKDVRRKSGKIVNYKGEELETKWTVALVCGNYLNGEMHGRNVDFNHRGKGFVLNYCPTCGRKLN